MLLRARNSPSLWSRLARAIALVLVMFGSVRPASAAGDSSGGLAVVAYPGATEAAWPLAGALYAVPALRPSGMDDPTARVLCGETPPGGSAAPLVDLAAAVAALQGEDAPSRILLVEIARRAGVRALVTVRIADGHAFARVFLADVGSFDAATFSPDAGPQMAWTGAVTSLARTYPVRTPEPSPRPVRSAPPLATRETPQNTPAVVSRPFYESAWFWGALGAAVLVGGGVYLATRDTSPSAIHLELQVH
jgi:hypothetical protein